MGTIWNFVIISHYFAKTVTFVHLTTRNEHIFTKSDQNHNLLGHIMHNF